MKKHFPILLAFLFSSISCFSQNSDSLECERIEKTIDEFKNEVTFYTSLSTNCSLSKSITKRGTTYYLSLYSIGYTSNFGIKGVKVLLSNSQVLSFPYEEIDVKVTDKADLMYSAFIRINQATLELLKKYLVTKWELYVYKGEQSESEAKSFQDQVNCISRMKK